MKGIVESINGVSSKHYRNMQWEIQNSLSHHEIIGKFNAPVKPYMWINTELYSIGFFTLEELRSNFKDFDMLGEFKNIEKLRPSESWSEDSMNIYLRMF